MTPFVCARCESLRVAAFVDQSKLVDFPHPDRNPDFDAENDAPHTAMRPMQQPARLSERQASRRSATTQPPPKKHTRILLDAGGRSSRFCIQARLLGGACPLTAIRPLARTKTPQATWPSETVAPGFRHEHTPTTHADAIAPPPRRELRTGRRRLLAFAISLRLPDGQSISLSLPTGPCAKPCQHLDDTAEIADCNCETHHLRPPFQLFR